MPAVAAPEGGDDRVDNLADSYKRCLESTVPVVAVAGCSAVIESGRLPRDALAYAHVMRCYGYARLGRAERADADCDKAVSLDDTAAARRVRAHAYRWLRRHDRAIAEIDLALTRDPKRWQDVLFRGYTNDWRGRYDDAVADFTRAMALGAPPRTHAERGASQLGRRDWKAAEADFAQALAAEPDDGTALYERGRLRFFRGEWQGAREDFERAADAQPENGFMLLWAYNAAARGGSGDAAAMLAKRAEKLDADEWPAELVEAYLGRRAADAVVPPKVPLELENIGHVIEKEYYLGMRDLLAGEREAAKARFEAAVAHGATEHKEHLAAQIELERLRR